MSTPATEAQADSDPRLAELPGQSALSDFRLSKLLETIRSERAGITALTARYAYFVSLNDPLSATDRDRLEALQRVG